jgi:antitoxin (DNA-binding transcriptional repressor) of toxin-antitoxin stability system
VPATEAAKSFGRLVDRVREEQAVYVVERGGVPVATIGPAPGRSCSLRELVELVRTLPRAGRAFGDAVEEGRSRANKPHVPEDRWAS